MLCEQEPLVMLSIVTHSAVCAVLTCLHVLLLSAAADNWRGLEHQSAHFCNCCDGEVWQPVSHCLQAPVCKPLSASPCLQALSASSCLQASFAGDACLACSLF